MTDFEVAENIIRSIKPLGITERISLSNSLYHVLAEDVFADMNMPPFNKSAVDGFACRREDLSLPLKNLETIAAGNSPSKKITKGSCSRIMTGAEVPQGADCIIMVEDSKIDENGLVHFIATSTSGNICFFGEDVKAGEKLLQSGTMIFPRHIPILASMGYSNPLVYKKPNVGIITTGSELVDISVKPGAGHIRNSNGPQLESQCAAMQIPFENLGIVPDSPDKIKKAILKSIEKHDVTIISGGVSVGDFDFVPGIIKELGFETKFHGLNIKPGKRMLFASKNDKYIFGLPGNPVSALVQFEMLVKPLLLKLQGCKELPGLEIRILSDDYILKKPSKPSFVPVIIQGDGSVKTTEYHGSAHVFVFSEANGFMFVPEGVKILEKGSKVYVRQV